MKKRGAISLLLLCLLVGIISTTVSATDDQPDSGTSSMNANIQSGNCGEEGNESSVTWTLTTNSDGSTYTLSISGSGAMADYTSNGQPWFSERSAITAIEIEEGVTRIGANAFRSSAITEMTIPASVNSIGEYAFLACVNLESFSLAEGENSSREFYIEDGIIYKNNGEGIELCFYPSAKTTEVFAIPDGVTKVEGHSMQYAQFKELQIPGTVLELGEYCFANSSLVSLEIPATVQTVGTYICSNSTALKSLLFHASVEETPLMLASGCSALEYVRLSNTIKILSNTTFKNDPSLKTIEFDENSILEEIKSSAFVNCGLEKLEIRTTSELNWMQQPYTGCASLKKLVFYSPKVTFNGVAFSKADSTPSEQKGDLVVLDLLNVESIGIANENNTRLKPMVDNSVILVDSKERADEIGICYDRTATAILVTNGGSFPEETEFASNTLAIPIREGYVFDGWYSNEECTGTASTTAEAGQTYYAKWVAVNIDPVSLEYGSTQPLPSIKGVTISDWKTTDPSIVTVSDGQITAQKRGKTTITATAVTDNGGRAVLSVDIEVTAMPLIFGTGKNENPQGTITYSYTGMAPEFSQFAKFYQAVKEGDKYKVGTKEITLSEGVDIVFVYNAGGGSNEYHYLPINVTDNQTGGIEVIVKLLNDNYCFVTEDKENLSQTIQENVIVRSEDMTEVSFVGLPSTGEKRFYEYTGEGIVPAGNLDQVKAGSIDRFTVHFHPWGETEFDEAHLEEQPASKLTQEEIQKIAPVELGTYLMIVSGKSDDEYAYQSWIFIVEKGTPKGTPVFEPVQSSVSLSSVALSGSLKNAAGIEVKGKFEWDDSSATVTCGTAYAWTFYPEDTEHYNVTTGRTVVWPNDSEHSDNITTENPKNTYGSEITIAETAESVNKKAVKTGDDTEGYRWGILGSGAVLVYMILKKMSKRKI